MFTSKVIIKEVSVSQSDNFRKALNDLLVVLYYRVRKPNEYAEGYIWEDGVIKARVICYWDGFSVHYTGYEPMSFRFGEV